MIPDHTKATTRHPQNRISPFWQFLPGLIITLLASFFCACYGLETEIPPILSSWMLTTPIFAGPVLLMFLFPEWQHPIVFLALSGMRLVMLPLLLFLLKNSHDGLDPHVLGWTIGLYIINLIGMILLEMRELGHTSSATLK